MFSRSVSGSFRVLCREFRAVPRGVFAESSSAAGETLTLNFFVPSQSILSGQEVSCVTVPGTEGVFGILPSHVPTVSQLQAGTVVIEQPGSEPTKYFISGGFAFVHPNSVADIAAVEAVRVEDLDADKVKEGLAKYEAEMSSATTEEAKAEAQIGFEVHTAMNQALSS